MVKLRKFIAIGLLAAVLLGMTACGKSTESSKDTIVLGGYTVPKEAYQKFIIPTFKKYWKDKTGKEVIFNESYEASGAQARAIAGGFEADVAALSLEGDIDQIVKVGLITSDWKNQLNNGFITNSVVVIGVRKGNPKDIKGWTDLTKSGIEVLYPNPKTSGGAMWDVNAIYGAALKQSEENLGRKDPDYAKDFLLKVQKNVKVMDKSGRESFSTFEQGVGDAVITYENEILRAIAEGANYEIVYPENTILIQNPIAIVDTNVEKHGNREVVEAFVNFLHTPKAQKAFADAGFRPVEESMVKEYGNKYQKPESTFDIDYLGGWEKVMVEIYGPEGIWNEVIESTAKG